MEKLADMIERLRIESAVRRGRSDGKDAREIAEAQAKRYVEVKAAWRKWFEEERNVEIDDAAMEVVPAANGGYIVKVHISPRGHFRAQENAAAWPTIHDVDDDGASYAVHACDTPVWRAFYDSYYYDTKELQRAAAYAAGIIWGGG